MEVDPRNASTEKNWRLQVELAVDDRPGALERLVGSLHAPGAVKDIEAVAPRDVVITHDGSLLFAYAADEATLRATADAVKGVLTRDGVTATSIRMSHWDGDLDDWRQTDPPVPAEKSAGAQAAARDAEAVETRTLVAHVGRAIRSEFEQSLASWAVELGVRCDVIDHRHLLTDRVGFTVTGPKRKLDEFAQGLEAEGWATLRTDLAVMLSPL